MGKLQSEPRFAGVKAAPAKGRQRQLTLPDPKLTGPFRHFTSDPGWNEAWWWLGLLAAVAFMLAFKIDGTASKWTEYTLLAARPSEAVEFYLYFFIFAYLVISSAASAKSRPRRSDATTRTLCTPSTKRHN